MVGRIARRDDERLISEAEREAVSSRTRRYCEIDYHRSASIPRR